MPSASIFRSVTSRLLVCGALLCTVLFAARLPVLAALCGLLTVAVAGAVRRLQEQRPGSVVHKLPAAAKPGPASLPDRQMLEARLDAEWKREGRPGEPTALLLIDVDAFAVLEEQSSSLAGQVAMLTLSSTLAHMLPRHADLLARYDQSTFAVMLQGTDLAGSLRVAARLRWAIVRLGIANRGTTSGFLTVSTGIAVQHELACGNTAALTAAAERALVAAQRLGHDQLEYVVLGAVNQPDKSPAAERPLPAIRAWTSEQASALHSPRS